MSSGRPETLSFDLSGIGVTVHGLPEGLATRLTAEWGPFTRAQTVSPVLEVHVRASGAGRWSSPFDPKSMEGRPGPTEAWYAMPEGRVEIGERGTARLELHATAGSRVYYAFLNLVRAAIAWRLPFREGALLHAAGIVIDGRAFVLVGPEGSGKSTWASVAEAAGALVLSDDVVILDGPGKDVEALGAPFRSTHPTPCGPGRWPLAAILVPARGVAPRLDPVKTMEVRAKLLANLPFLTEAIAADPRIAGVIERLVASVPARRLTFSPDPAFLPLLREAELGGRA